MNIFGVDKKYNGHVFRVRIKSDSDIDDDYINQQCLINDMRSFKFDLVDACGPLILFQACKCKPRKCICGVFRDFRRKALLVAAMCDICIVSIVHMKDPGLLFTIPERPCEGDLSWQA